MLGPKASCSGEQYLNFPFYKLFMLTKSTDRILKPHTKSIWLILYYHDTQKAISMLFLDLYTVSLNILTQMPLNPVLYAF